MNLTARWKTMADGGPGALLFPPESGPIYEFSCGCVIEIDGHEHDIFREMDVLRLCREMLEVETFGEMSLIVHLYRITKR